MTEEEFNALRVGDVIRSAGGHGCVVHGRYGHNRVVVVRAQLAMNPHEWEKVGDAPPATALALLAELAEGGGDTVDSSGDVRGWHCVYCMGWWDSNEEQSHEPQCPIRRARELLA